MTELTVHSEFEPKISYRDDERDPFISDCPSWCVLTHAPLSRDADRHHGGQILSVLVADVVGEYNFYDGQGTTLMGHVLLYLIQNANDAEPAIKVVLNDSPTAVQLRLAEAELLSGAQRPHRGLGMLTPAAFNQAERQRRVHEDGGSR